MIDPAVRAKAVRILRAAATPETTMQNLVKTAADVGLDVKYDAEADDGNGPDMEACELAALAWCRTADSKPPGTTDARDYRLDAVAADQLESGWEPEPYK